MVTRTFVAQAAMTLAASLAALFVVAMLGAPKEADASSRFKTVSRTLTNVSPITIRDLSPATPYPSTINARGFEKGRILDVNVTLHGYSHTWPHDVDVLLVHRERERTILSDVGGNFDVNDLTITLDDEAASTMHETNQLSAGKFQPTNTGGTSDPFAAPAPTASGLEELSGFDGSNPNGAWHLYLVDDGTGDAGQFARGWSLQVKAKVRR